MLMPIVPQCRDVNNLFAQISSTAFFNKPIVLQSDSDTIRSSDTFQCIVTFLVVQTTLTISNMDATGLVDVPMEKSSHIVVYGNESKFKLLRWLWLLSLPKKTLPSRCRILVVLKSPANPNFWLAYFYYKLSAVEVTVLVLENESFYTWFPYRAPECRDVNKIVQIDLHNLFPRKIFNDLQGCYIYTVAFISVPDVIDKENGKELEIMRVITKKLNLTVQITIVNERTDPLNADFINNLVKLRAYDVMIGSKVTNYWAHADFDPAQPHSFEKAIYLCPAPKPISGMVHLINAFSFETWLCVLATLIAITLAFYGMKYQSCVFRAWAMILSLPYGNIELDGHNLFTTLSYFCCICLTTAYQASLFLILQTIPREKPFTTAEELYESNYTNLLYGYPALDYPHPERVKIIPWPPTEEFAAGDAYGLIINSMFKYYLNTNRNWFIDNSGHPKHTIVPHERMNMISFLLSPGHPLLDLFSDVTLRLVEGGFPGYFDKRFEYFFADEELINTPIAIVKVIGILYVSLFLYLLAFIIFVIEWCWERKNRALQSHKIHCVCGFSKVDCIMRRP